MLNEVARIIRPTVVFITIVNLCPKKPTDVMR